MVIETLCSKGSEYLISVEALKGLGKLGDNSILFGISPPAYTFGGSKPGFMQTASVSEDCEICDASS